MWEVLLRPQIFTERFHLQVGQSSASGKNNGSRERNHYIDPSFHLLSPLISQFAKCFDLSSASWEQNCFLKIITCWAQLVRITYHSCCSKETMPLYLRADTIAPLISVTLTHSPDNLMLNKIHSGDLVVSHRNKCSASLTPREPFTHTGGRSCIFKPNLFLILPQQNRFKTRHPPSTAVLSIRLMSVASTNPRHAVPLWSGWQLEFTGAQHRFCATFGSWVVSLCMLSRDERFGAKYIYLKRYTIHAYLHFWWGLSAGKIKLIRDATSPSKL